MSTTTFGIGGMHCASCSTRNERTLAKLHGVTRARVNLATNTARVDFDRAAFFEAHKGDAMSCWRGVETKP
jgi:copper chaperone CopZ